MNPTLLLVSATLPMNSDFEDPNNHVPEVTPDDGWGDDSPAAEPTGSAPNRIPAKRSAKEARSGDSSIEVREVKPVEEDLVQADASETGPERFEDPNNHVPKLTVADEWEEEGSDASMMLPKRRAADERPAGYAAKAVDDDEKGVEIGIKVIERAQDQDARGPVQRLEILDHAPKNQSQDGGSLPRVVPKQVIEKQETPDDDEAAEATWHGRTPDSESWGKQRSVPMRWIVISGAILAVGIIAGVLALPHLGWKGERSVRTNFSNLEVMETPMLETEAGKVSSLDEGIEGKAKILVEAYAKAGGVEQVLPLVRDRERLEKIIRERWVRMEVPSNWHVPDESKWEILRTGNREYGFLTGLLPDVTPFRFYIVQEGDKALLDWEASTGYSETKFTDLSKRQGEGGIVRAYVSPGDLYTFSLPESEYQCFRITSSDADISVWGYAKRKEPVAEKLAEPFLPGVIPREVRSEYPMTLKLAKPPAESLPNQWVITEMVQMEWLIP